MHYFYLTLHLFEIRPDKSGLISLIYSNQKLDFKTRRVVMIIEI
jgi:hypothetical protein